MSKTPAISLLTIFTVANSCGAPNVNWMFLISPEKALAVFLSKNCEGTSAVIWATLTVVGLVELETVKSIGFSIEKLVGDKLVTLGL